MTGWEVPKVKKQNHHRGRGSFRGPDRFGFL